MTQAAECLGPKVEHVGRDRHDPRITAYGDIDVGDAGGRERQHADQSLAREDRCVRHGPAGEATLDVYRPDFDHVRTRHEKGELLPASARDLEWTLDENAVLRSL